jgi:VIT1/CCC1 family predicted Fe2+/Mn2+ transporter
MDESSVPHTKRGAGLSAQQRARLLAESKTPYKGLRRFIYLTFGASGLIGGFVFLAQVASGRDVATALPNLALQVGVVALMVALFRWEGR